MKILRQVFQELLVSIKIDVSLLFLGVYVLNHSSQEMQEYCKTCAFAKYPSPFVKSLSPTKNTKSYRADRTEAGNFVYVRKLVRTSFAEAKARCHALKHYQM